MSFLFIFPPRNAFKYTANSTALSWLSRSFRPHIHPSIYTPPPGLTLWSILKGGLPSFRLRQHYSMAQPTSAYPLPLNRVPETHPQGPPPIQHALSYRTRPTFGSPLLSSFNGADLPFLRTICKAVLTIRSQFSEYEFDVILSALSVLQAPSFQAPMRATKSNLPHHKEGGANSP